MKRIKFHAPRHHRFKVGSVTIAGGRSDEVPDDVAEQLAADYDEITIVRGRKKKSNNKKGAK